MIKRVKQGAVIAAALGASILVTGAAGQTTPTEEAKSAKEVTIMSRILEKKLSDELKDDVIRASMFQRGVQGFYVPDVGALFFVDVKFAVAEPPEEEEEKKKEERDDLWDQFEREVEGRPIRGPVGMYGGGGFGGFFYGDSPAGPQGYYGLALNPRPAGVDKAKVQLLKSTIFEVLARYGQRIETLKVDERIIIVVSGASGTVPFALNTYEVTPGPAAVSVPRVRLKTAKTIAENVGPQVEMALAVGEQAAQAAVQGQEIALNALESAEPFLDEKQLEEARKALAQAQQLIQRETAQAAAKAQEEVSKALEAAEVQYSETLAETQEEVLKSVAAAQKQHAAAGTIYRATMAGMGRPSVLIIQIRRDELVDDAEKVAERAEIETYCY